MQKITVLIVDDHLLVRSGIRSLLKDIDEINVIDEAENGLEAIEKTVKLNPDVILMDISMPDMSGLDATAEIKKRSLPVNILILTMHENEEYIYSALKLGASGILHKNISKEELILAIKTVASGKRYFGLSISQIVIENLIKKFDESMDSKADTAFTKREKEVLHLIAEGHPNHEIAVSLGISSRTVDSHKTNLMQKLNIKSSAALTKYAIKNGF